MATVNVYVPEELKERLEGSGLNLSAVARRCWETELELAEVATEEVRAVVGPPGEEEELRFEGALLAESSDASLYLTEEGSLVIVEEERWRTADRSEMDAEALEAVFRGDQDAYREACEALDLRPIRRL